MPRTPQQPYLFVEKESLDIKQKSNCVRHSSACVNMCRNHLDTLLFRFICRRRSDHNLHAQHTTSKSAAKWSRHPSASPDLERDRLSRHPFVHFSPSASLGMGRRVLVSLMCTSFSLHPPAAGLLQAPHPTVSWTWTPSLPSSK